MKLKEQRISLLMSKMGLDEQRAEQAVSVVPEYVEDKPQQMTPYLEGAGRGPVAGTLSSMPDK